MSTIGFVHSELVEELLKECAKMCDFDHPNVLTVSGVCLDGGPAPFIIMPFMANGSLHAYLREKREELVLDSNSIYDQDDVVNKYTIKGIFVTSYFCPPLRGCPLEIENCYSKVVFLLGGWVG